MLPTGDLILGVPAPAGTWPEHESSSEPQQAKEVRPGGQAVQNESARPGRAVQSLDLATRICRAGQVSALFPAGGLAAGYGFLISCARRVSRPAVLLSAAVSPCPLPGRRAS
jgi:hypothetical protein